MGLTEWYSHGSLARAVAGEVEAVVVDWRKAEDCDVVKPLWRARGKYAAQRLCRALEREWGVGVCAEEEPETPVCGAHDPLAEGTASRLEAPREEVVERRVFVDRLLGLLRAAAGDRGELRYVLFRLRRVVAAAHHGRDRAGAEENRPERAAEQCFVCEAERLVAHNRLGDALPASPVYVFYWIHAAIIAKTAVFLV